MFLIFYLSPLLYLLETRRPLACPSALVFAPRPLAYLEALTLFNTLKRNVLILQRCRLSRGRGLTATVKRAVIKQVHVVSAGS